MFRFLEITQTAASLFLHNPSHFIAQPFFDFFCEIFYDSRNFPPLHHLFQMTEKNFVSDSDYHEWQEPTELKLHKLEMISHLPCLIPFILIGLASDMITSLIIFLKFFLIV